jgi:hypothetical protein
MFMNLLDQLRRPAALTVALVLAFGIALGGAAPALAQDQAPKLHCSIYNPVTNQLTIDFGYINSGSTAEMAAIGPDNFFLPGALNRASPRPPIRDVVNFTFVKYEILDIWFRYRD